MAMRNRNASCYHAHPVTTLVLLPLQLVCRASTTITLLPLIIPAAASSQQPLDEE